MTEFDTWIQRINQGNISREYKGEFNQNLITILLDTYYGEEDKYWSQPLSTSLRLMIIKLFKSGVDLDDPCQDSINLRWIQHPFDFRLLVQLGADINWVDSKGNDFLMAKFNSNRANLDLIKEGRIKLNYILQNVSYLLSVSDYNFNKVNTDGKTLLDMINQVYTELSKNIGIKLRLQYLETIMKIVKFGGGKSASQL